MLQLAGQQFPQCFVGGAIKKVTVPTNITALEDLSHATKNNATYDWRRDDMTCSEYFRRSSRKGTIHQRLQRRYKAERSIQNPICDRSAISHAKIAASEVIISYVSRISLLSLITSAQNAYRHVATEGIGGRTCMNRRSNVQGRIIENPDISIPAYVFQVARIDQGQLPHSISWLTTTVDVTFFTVFRNSFAFNTAFSRYIQTGIL